MSVGREGLMDVKLKKLCVVGVSPKPDKFGNKIFKSLVEAGFTVYGVHPRTEEVAGRRIFRSLRDLPVVPDQVITVVPPEVTERIVEEAYSLGVSEIWMQPGSESETAIGKARGYGMTVIAHACFMVKHGIW